MYIKNIKINKGKKEGRKEGKKEERKERRKKGIDEDSDKNVHIFFRGARRKKKEMF